MNISFSNQLAGVDRFIRLYVREPQFSPRCPCVPFLLDVLEEVDIERFAEIYYIWKLRAMDTLSQILAWQAHSF